MTKKKKMFKRDSLTPFFAIGVPARSLWQWLCDFGQT